MKSAAETTLKTSQKTDRGRGQSHGDVQSASACMCACERVCVVGISKKGRTLVRDRYLEERWLKTFRTWSKAYIYWFLMLQTSLASRRIS